MGDWKSKRPDAGLQSFRHFRIHLECWARSPSLFRGQVTRPLALQKSDISAVVSVLLGSLHKPLSSHGRKDLSGVESHSPHNSLEQGSKSACFPSLQGTHCLWQEVLQVSQWHILTHGNKFVCLNGIWWCRPGISALRMLRQEDH